MFLGRRFILSLHITMSVTLLTHRRFLDISGCPGISRLDPLASCPDLISLVVGEGCAPNGLRPLRACRKLLDLDWSQPGSLLASHFSLISECCPNVVCLNLSKCDSEDNGLDLRPLVNCKQLRTLYVPEANIAATRKHEKALKASLPNLRIY